MEKPETPSNERSLPKKIFLSPDEPRLRAGWRLLIQTLLIIFLGAIITIPVLFILELTQPALSPVTETIINGAISLASITAAVFFARRLFDRRTITSLGLNIHRYALEDLLAGFLIPALMIALILFLERIFGWTEFVGIAMGQSILETVQVVLISGLVPFIFVGWQEELLFRGYYLQNLEDGLNLPWAVLLSSVLFGALHLINPNSEQFIMVTLGILLSGVFLAYAYIRTRQLWLPLGLHIGWNFFEGPIFGFPVSGLKAGGVFVHEATGPGWITGGAFGPEAGLILLPALILGFGLVYFVTNERKPVKIV